MAKQVKPKKKLAINPTSGKLDLITDNNFSYQSVPAGKKLQIPDNNQMTVRGPFDCEGGLEIEGSFIQEE